MKRNGYFAALLAAAVCALLILGFPSRADAQAKGTQKSVQKVTPSLNIVYFRKAVDSGTMRAAIKPGSGSSDTATVDLGDDIGLTWRIEACGVSGVMATLTGVGRVNPGTARDLRTGCKYYINTRSVRPGETTTYTLRVSAAPGAGSALRSLTAEKTFTVRVLAPRIEPLAPRVDQNTRRVTFSARNRGDATFRSTRINVRYRISGGGRMIAEDSFTTEAMEIRRGATLELGAITLPDNIYQYSSLGLNVTLGASYRAPLRETTGSFTHRWTDHTLRLDERLLRLVGMMFSGSIRINNYVETRARVRKDLPYQRNDCYVELMGERRTFHLGYFKFGSTPTEWFFLFRNVQAHRISGEDLFFIRGGKLGFRIEFDTSPSREIKGWARNAVEKNYNDDWAPDVEINRLNLDILMTPTLRGQTISYSAVEADPDLDFRVPGGWAGLNALKGWATDYINREIRSIISSMLMDSEVRGPIETELTRQVGTFVRDLHYMVSLRGAGSEIILTYR
jgi:hypothetical protein